jgi:ferredoxin
VTGFRVTLDENVCAGFGTCRLTAPEVFGWDDDELIGTVLRAEIDDTGAETARLAESDCPTRAIRVEPR